MTTICPTLQDAERKRLVPVANAPRAGSDPATAARRAPEILLVEDDAEMRRLMARALRGDGYTVVECENGDQAFDWLSPGVIDGAFDRMPAVIVTDVRLPYWSGLEILEGVQCSERPVPVILVTGFPDEETYAQAFALGARCVLAKPFDLDDLRGAVYSALPPGARREIVRHAP